MDKDFRYLSIGLPARLVAAGGMFALGAAVELLIPRPMALGAAIAVLGWLPLMLARATNKPKDQGLEEWRPVSMAEIDRLDDGLRESKKLRRRVRSPSTLLFLLFGIPFLFVVLVAGAVLGRNDVAFVAVNAAIFLVPACFFGRVSVFEPAEIAFKMPSFRAVLAEPQPQGTVVAPYIRFDKDDKGMDVPEDLRLLLELKRPPADLVGVQVQAAINKGPNGAVPYLYAVVLTHGTDGPSHKAARRLSARGFEVEAGGDAEYGTVVLRQATSGGGYYTDPDDCRRLAALCYSFLSSLQA